MNNINYRDILAKGFQDSIVYEDSWKIDLICREFWSEMNDMEKYKLFFGKLSKFEKRYFDKVLLPRFQSQEELEIDFAENELKEELEMTFENEESKEQIKPPTSPDQMYGLLGVDALSLHVGANLIELADTEQGGKLLPDLGLLRQHMTLIYGYILPPVRINDNKVNEPNEYKVVIRGNAVSSSTAYPDRYIILQSQWDKTFDKPPTEFLEGLEPVTKEKAYWLKPDYLNKLVEDKSWTYPYLTAVQAITYHLMEIVLENIEELFTKADLRRVLDQVRETDFVLVDNVLNVLNISTLRKVLINLIREKVSIKDIYYILENLEDLATETTDSDLLSEKLRILLARQISATNALENKTILTITLEPALEEKLAEFVHRVNNKFILVLTPDQAVCFIRKILDISKEINCQYNRRPIVLTATPTIRLPLARLIHGLDNQTAVMTYTELSNDFRTEILNTVGLNDLVNNCLN